MTAIGGTPVPTVRGSADTEEKLKKRSQMVASGGICGKDIDLFFMIFL